MLSGPTTIAVAPGKPKAPPYAALRAVRRRRRSPLDTEKRADERGWEMQTLQLRVRWRWTEDAGERARPGWLSNGRNVWKLMKPLFSKSRGRRMRAGLSVHRHRTKFEPDDVGLCRVRGLMSSDCRSTLDPKTTFRLAATTAVSDGLLTDTWSIRSSGRYRCPVSRPAAGREVTTKPNRSSSVTFRGAILRLPVRPIRFR